MCVVGVILLDLDKFVIQQLALIRLVCPRQRISYCSPLVLLLFCWFIVTMMSEPEASFWLLLFYFLYVL